MRSAVATSACLVVLAACQSRQPPPSVSPAVAPAASPSVAVVSVASPSPRAAPLASPSVARQRVPLRLAVSVDPPNPTAGQAFTLTLAITNEGTRPADGVYVSTGGPWDRYTVLSVRPAGAFVRDAMGWHFGSPLRIPPGQTQSLTVEARADEPSEQQLTFAVRESDPGEVP